VNHFISNTLSSSYNFVKLATRGVDVLSLIDYEIPTQEIEDFFGLKVSKNGYMYNKKVGAKVAKNVFELYKHVTSKQKVTNQQINKCFAHHETWHQAQLGKICHLL
jgi:hypothetical protein